MTKLNGRVARGKLRARQREKERDVHCAVFGQTARKRGSEREQAGKRSTNKQRPKCAAQQKWFTVTEFYGFPAFY